jgi:hypothetical protein
MTIVRCKDITGTGSFNIVTGRWLAIARGHAIDPKPLVGKLTPAAALCRSRRRNRATAQEFGDRPLQAILLGGRTVSNIVIPRKPHAIQIVVPRQIRHEVRLFP